MHLQQVYMYAHQLLALPQVYFYTLYITLNLKAGSYTEYHADDYYNCTSKYWQIAYYQHCLLLMTNEEANQYAIQTMDNAQFMLI